MRIAMIGQKGVPATHGGIERHVEELSARLAALGHEVTVFTRPNYTSADVTAHRGAGLKSLPTVGTKHLDAIVHTALATSWSMGRRFDVLHYHGMGPCLVSPLGRLTAPRVIATIHGQDWRRQKWGKAASGILRLSEQMALRVPDRTIVVSEVLTEQYRAAGHGRVVFVPNGVSVPEGSDDSILDELRLTDGGYVLFASRLVPEKGVHLLLEAWRRLDPGIPLVIAGDTSHSDGYVEELRRAAAPGVLFPGYVYGEKLAALFRHAALFVLPSLLEGLPLVLLVALAYGVPVLASDIPPNVEVLGSDGHYFRAGDAEDLERSLADALAQLEERRSGAAQLAERVAREYDWDAVTERTVRVYEGEEL